jgi:hypothetical protein
VRLDVQSNPIRAGAVSVIGVAKVRVVGGSPRTEASTVNVPNTTEVSGLIISNVNALLNI